MQIEELKTIAIGELYDFIESCNHTKLRDLPENSILSVDFDIKADSMNKDLQFETNPVNYVMKHKVNKEMVNIIVEDSYVKMTCDHSLIVMRDDQLLDISPKHLKSGDCINFQGYWTDDFTVEFLGFEELDVYDIEVENNHNFIANGFLVHNSVYFSIEPIVNKKFDKTHFDLDDPQLHEVVDYVAKFGETFLQKTIDESNQFYCDLMNIYNPKVIAAAREVISDRAMFLNKKKYFMRVLDSEGVRMSFNDPYIKTMGIEIAKGSTPPFVKKKLQEAIPVILDSTPIELRKWRDQVKLEFCKQPIKDICITQGITKVDSEPGKGIPQGTKSAMCHNKFVIDNKLEAEIPLLQPGEKYKRCYLKTPNRFNSEIISFNDEKIEQMIEQDQIYDYQTNFEKFFEQPFENMCYELNVKTETVFDDGF